MKIQFCEQVLAEWRCDLCCQPRRREKTFQLEPLSHEAASNVEGAVLKCRSCGNESIRLLISTLNRTPVDVDADAMLYEDAPRSADTPVMATVEWGSLWAVIEEFEAPGGALLHRLRFPAMVPKFEGTYEEAARILLESVWFAVAETREIDLTLRYQQTAENVERRRRMN